MGPRCWYEKEGGAESWWQCTSSTPRFAWPPLPFWTLWQAGSGAGQLGLDQCLLWVGYFQVGEDIAAALDHLGLICPAHPLCPFWLAACSSTRRSRDRMSCRCTGGPFTVTNAWG